MTKYREILRLTALGLSQRDICSSASVSQKTVSKVQKRARELDIEWPLDESVKSVLRSKVLAPIVLPPKLYVQSGVTASSVFA